MRLLCLIALTCLAAPAYAADPPACTPFGMTAQDARLVTLGQLLFYDPILSGGREVACATCHHPDHATADGVALGLGDGGRGLGPDRAADPANLPEQRIPRNAPALFNLGAAEFTVMFHDGRLEDRPGARRTPFAPGTIAHDLPMLAAQALLPLMSPDEMAGHYSESEVSTAVRRGDFEAAWAAIAARVFAISDYADSFAELGMIESPVPIAEALGAFIAAEWRADDSLFDRHICKGASLDILAAAGMELFYGKAGCADCHAGRFQTDHGFHAIAMPQIGPGKAARFESHARDTGRERVTGQTADAYRFRTPSLRNVVLTAPYGHAGAYATLEAVVRHHLDPVASLKRFSKEQVALTRLEGAEDFRALDDTAEVEQISAANELAPQELSDSEVQALLAFLETLTDARAVKGRMGVPETVPSGLKIP